VCGESLVYDPVTGLGGPYSDHDDELPYDPAYPDPTPEDYCSMPLFHDGPCDSPLAHSPDDDHSAHRDADHWFTCDACDDEAGEPDDELPYDPAYYSDGSRV
jgi:hypothetical protein